MKIADIFYNNIVPEAQNGRIDCFVFYNIAFSTYIVDNDESYICNISNNDLLIPTLIIRDKNKFDSLLEEYVTLALSFYDDNNFDEDILDYKLYDNKKRICKEKAILALLFANATVEDFNNPINFLEKRINFINNSMEEKHNLGYCEILNTMMQVSIEKDIINNETPYQFVIKILSYDGESYVLPKVKFGISDNNVYVYAIQNENNQKNQLGKRINRILYKIGEGYNDGDYLCDDENLKDISASFLVSLNIFVNYVKTCGYNKIIVPSILVERWNAKKISSILRSNRYGYSVEKMIELEDSQDYLQRNLTNKLIRTFLRLGVHYNNIDIFSFPYEIDSCLHININDERIRCNNTLLFETGVLMRDYFKKDKKVNKR